MTLEQLDLFVKHEKAVLFHAHLLATFERFDINTPPRQRHFLAQILHESGNFQYTEELASGAAYEGRKDLGNVVAGDGKKFKGRGLIQLTGRANYKAFSDFIGVDFVNNPEKVAEPLYACMSAGFFWQKNMLNKIADMPDSKKLNLGKRINISPIEYISIRVNGGTNGLEERKKIYVFSKSVIKE